MDLHENVVFEDKKKKTKSKSKKQPMKIKGLFGDILEDAA